jgi:hypothetical protein
VKPAKGRFHPDFFLKSKESLRNNVLPLFKILIVFIMTFVMHERCGCEGQKIGLREKRLRDSIPIMAMV